MTSPDITPEERAYIEWDRICRAVDANIPKGWAFVLLVATPHPSEKGYDIYLSTGNIHPRSAAPAFVETALDVMRKRLKDN